MIEIFLLIFFFLFIRWFKEALLEGYESIRPLTSQEKEAILNFIQIRKLFYYLFLY